MNKKLLSIIFSIVIVLIAIPAVAAANVDLYPPESYSSTVNNRGCDVGDTVEFSYYAKFDKLIEDFQGYASYPSAGLRFDSVSMSDTQGVFASGDELGKVNYNGVDFNNHYNFTTEKLMYKATFTVIAKGDWTISNTLVRVDDLNSQPYVKKSQKLMEYTERSVTEVTHNHQEQPTTPTTPVTEKYNVTVTAENGTVTGCPAEAVESGTSVTLAAKANEGYSFKGFYKNDVKISSDSTYTFMVEETTNIVAKFQQNPCSELSVFVTGGTGLKVKIGTNGTESKQGASYKNSNVVKGKYITLSPIGINGYTFRYWTNSNGKIISYKESYTFLFNGKTSLTAVYSDTLGEEVTFISGYNQINSSMCYGSADEIEIPEPYSKTGYVFKFWTIDGTTEATAEQIYEASVTENVIVKAVYEAEKVYYNINITDGSIVSVDDDKTDAGKTSGSYISAAAIRVIANEAPEGKKFAYWKNQKGEIITYAKECYVYLMENTTLTAVYVDEAEAIDAKAVASISSITLDETTNKMKVIANLSVPEGCTIITAGLVATDDATVGTNADAFNSANAKYFKSQNIEDQNVVNCRYTWTKSNVTTGDIWYLRGYVTYKDSNGNIYEVYGDIVKNTDFL